MRFLPAFLLATVAVAPLAAAPLPAPAPLPAIAAQVNIPYQEFTLANGLHVIVSTDHSAPVVAVSVWYHVGSKDEPAGKTGFAHLFEHLMFYGSENVPGGVFGPLEQMGATDWNGTTWYDRTNYFETVPTPSLARTLFLESDRMGHLLGAVSQQTLDRQRGVVQNEKRQRDNDPFGLVGYAEGDALYPADHPYHHSVIGSMTDLNGASLEDVRGWFRGHYGPNNATLVLAGDVDLATAKAMVGRYFGDIPRGPQPAPTQAQVPTLAAPKSETLHDQVATTRLYREWTIPGFAAPDTVSLDIFASVLGGLASSRFDNELVRKEKLAVSASADVDDEEKVSIFRIAVDVAPGVDPAVVAKRIDAITADLIANGPTEDEIKRAVTHEVSGRLYGLESVGGFSGRAATLAEGALYAGDTGFYKKQLGWYAAATPASVKAAAQKWLTRPVYALTVVPGPRAPYEEAKADKVDAAKPTSVAAAPAASGAAAKVAPRQVPPAGEMVALRYPPITHAHLSNGIELIYAQRGTLPISRVVLSFDAGHSADPKDARGTNNMMLDLLSQGTTTRTAAEIAADSERFGIAIGAGASMDRSVISLSGLSANLAAGIDLLADVTLNPSYADIERVRTQELTGIAAELTDPEGIAGRALPPLIYAGYPYDLPPSGNGDASTVKALSKADLEAFKAKWIRPDLARIFVVSDEPLAAIQPLLEARFGGWKGAGSAGAKQLGGTVPHPRSRVVLIDRPASPQSIIYGGYVLDHTGTDDMVTLDAANDSVGGSITSRLGTDLREQKNWSYGVQSFVSDYVGRVPFKLLAPVQTDQTGPSIKAMLGDLNALIGDKPITVAERDRTVQRSIRELPGVFATPAALLAAMQKNALLKRPDDYYAHLADRYRALTPADLQASLKADLRPGDIVWIVVGDAAKVKPQLDGLGLPVEVAKAPAAK